MTAEMIRVRAVLTHRSQTYPQIAAAAHLSHREAMQAVHDLRHAHVPIVSDGAGQRLTGDPAEVAAYALALHSRAVETLSTADAMAETCHRMNTVPTYTPAETPTLWRQTA